MRDALLAYCPHGPNSIGTFETITDLDAMKNEDVENLLEEFVTASKRENDVLPKWGTCPPFIERAFKLGRLRQQREEARKKPMQQVIAATSTGDAVWKTIRKTNVDWHFDDPIEDWKQKQWESMTEEEQTAARKAWNEAFAEENEAIKTTNMTAEVEEREQIRNAMRTYMKTQLRWTERELHDCCVIIGPQENIQNQHCRWDMTLRPT